MKSFESKNWKFIRHLFSDFISKNHEFNSKVFVVGGAVRDSLMNPLHNPTDFDLIVELPQGAKKLALCLHQFNLQTSTEPFEKGRGYPTWSMNLTTNLPLDKINLDISDTQKEAFPDPQTRQRVTSFGSKSEDILRRDFTINSISFDLSTDTLSSDSASYITDLNHKILRHHPQVPAEQMFSDDPLRMLRAIRFCSTHQFQIHPQTLDALVQNINRLQIVSAERKYSELQKIAALSSWNRFIHLAIEWNIFSKLFPHLTLSNTYFDPADKNEIFEAFLLSFYKNSFLQIQNTMIDYKFSKKDLQNLKTIHNCFTEIHSLELSSWKIRNLLRKNFNFISFLKLIPELYEKTKDIYFDEASSKGQLSPSELIKIFKIKGDQIQKTYDYSVEEEDQYFTQNKTPIPRNDLIEKTKDYVTKNFSRAD